MITIEETMIGMLEKRGLLQLALAIAAEHHVDIMEMLGTSHETAPSWARHAFWAALIKLPGWSASRIGRLTDRDHTSVLLGIRKHTRRMLRGESPLCKAAADEAKKGAA